MKKIKVLVVPSDRTGVSYFDFSIFLYIYNKIYNKPPSLLENSKNMYNHIKSNVKDRKSEIKKIIKSVELLKNKITTDLVYENKTDILKEIDELLNDLKGIRIRVQR